MHEKAKVLCSFSCKFVSLLMTFSELPQLVGLVEAHADLFHTVHIQGRLPLLSSFNGYTDNMGLHLDACELIFLKCSRLIDST